MHFSNINVEYLSQMLQNKIYNAENPFSFDKLFKSERLQVFSNIHQYLEHVKDTRQANDFNRELIITTSHNLRIGDVVYWLHNLNKNQPKNSFLIATQPWDEKLGLKPFKEICNV